VEIFERNRWYTSGYYGRDKNVYCKSKKFTRSSNPSSALNLQKSFHFISLFKIMLSKVRMRRKVGKVSFGTPQKRRRKKLCIES
jgi:hypothetical protein